MRGGYWVANLDGGLNSPAVQLATECATLFGKTRFWRLQPHPEMLQGPQESPFEKRRRKKAEATEKAVPPTSDKKPPTGPIYVLADPSWEYVVYFTQGGSITLDLLEATGTVHFAWYNPRTHTSIQEGDMLGGDYRTFQAPDSEDWVLSLSRK